MRYEYYVGVFTLHGYGSGNDEWSRATPTPTNPYVSETLGEWLGRVTSTQRGVEIVSITETGERLTAIARMLVPVADTETERDPTLYEPMR